MSFRDSLNRTGRAINRKSQFSLLEEDLTWGPEGEAATGCGTSQILDASSKDPMTSEKDSSDSMLIEKADTDQMNIKPKYYSGNCVPQKFRR